MRGASRASARRRFAADDAPDPSTTSADGSRPTRALLPLGGACRPRARCMRLCSSALSLSHMHLRLPAACTPRARSCAARSHAAVACSARASVCARGVCSHARLSPRVRVYRLYRLAPYQARTHTPSLLRRHAIVSDAARASAVCSLRAVRPCVRRVRARRALALTHAVRRLACLPLVSPHQIASPLASPPPAVHRYVTRTPRRSSHALRRGCDVTSARARRADDVAGRILSSHRTAPLRVACALVHVASRSSP